MRIGMNVLLVVSILLLPAVVDPRIAAATNATKAGPSIRERCTLMPYIPLCSFNPALLSGIRGLPGIRARLNTRMWRYASQLVGELLSREIQHARLPAIIQATKPLLDGNIVLYNGHVARYRCPERVVVLTKSPNKLLLQLQNYDIGINANVAGHVNMMVPMPAELVVPSGVLRIDLQGLILSVELAVEHGSFGPNVRVTSCSNHIDKVDISMKDPTAGNGTNTKAFLKNFVSKFVRDMLPHEICKMVPKIMDQQINTRFASIPQAIALGQLAALTGLGLFTAPSKPDPAFCLRECGLDVSLNATKPRIPRSPSKQTSKNHLGTSRHLCSQCTAAEDESLVQGFAKNLNLRRLTDMFVSVKMLNDYASDDGLTVDLSGEFSPGGKGGTPFGPFPVLFPAPRNNHMAEIIVSDYTINSLLYWVHRKGFISFRIEPDTPKFGDLLKTTCGDEEDGDYDLGGEETPRAKREPGDDEPKEGLTEMGICLGELLPAIKDRYPKRRAFLNINATRAPSILFSEKKEGSASLDIQAEADLFIEDVPAKVGTLVILVEVKIALHLRGQKVFGSGEITSLQLKDKTGTLGLPEEALDNLGVLGKDLIEKQANKALQKGIPIHITQSPGQPATFYNLQIKLIRHGLYVASDLTISQALLGTLTYAGSCYKF